MTPLRRHDMRLRSATTDEIAAVWDDRWYGLVVGLDTVYMPSDVDGLALVDDRDELVALVTYHVDGPAGQIVTLDTMVRGRGFGRRLLEARRTGLIARCLPASDGAAYFIALAD